MIKTVIFDLGRVLIPFDFARGYQTMSELLHLPPEEVKARVSHNGIVNDFESGRVSATEFHDRVSAQLGTRLDYRLFCDIWNSVFLPCTLIPESMVEAIRRRYRTVLLSNTNPIHFSMLWATYPILKHFDALVLSHEVGAMKPLAPMYASAIKHAQCQPSECFFTDDVAEYVAGARAAGIDAVQFQSCDQIVAELAARGVTW